MSDWHNPGELVLLFRQMAGLTLRGAESASGLSASYLSRVERGEHRPTPNTLMKVANAILGPLGLDDSAAPAMTVILAAYGYQRTPEWHQDIRERAEVMTAKVSPGFPVKLLADSVGSPRRDNIDPLNEKQHWAVWFILVWAEARGRAASLETILDLCERNAPHEAIEEAMANLPLPQPRDLRPSWAKEWNDTFDELPPKLKQYAMDYVRSLMVSWRSGSITEYPSGFIGWQDVETARRGQPHSTRQPAQTLKRLVDDLSEQSVERLLAIAELLPQTPQDNSEPDID